MLASHSPLYTVAHLRLQVAALGERLSPPWWRTEFLSQTGLRYVARIFSRTALTAALESTTMAARREHDASIGRRSFHLFRLPAHLESQLAHVIHTDGVFTDSGLPDTPEDIIAALEVLALQDTTLTGAGPRLLGSIKDIHKPATITKLAALYAHAARKGERTYPYFEAVEHG